MESFSSFLVLSFGALFAILNPMATIPPFMAMTADNTIADRNRMARTACVVACVVLIVFALTGMTILNFFGITVPAFRIAGGLVLIRASFLLLQGERASVSPEERREGVAKDDISITPLAIPILCGPGTITAAILISSQATSWFHTSALATVITLIYASIYLLLRFASANRHFLGDTPIKITSRLMGLILVAVAVQFMLDGLREAGGLGA
jgi:multiple antibiotic resistance protein